MKWTVSKITDELKGLSKSFDDEFSIPVAINGRLSTSLGRTFSNFVLRDGKSIAIPTKMDFSKRFLESATDKSIIGVIRHEWAHYYLCKTTHENHGHDTMFKDLCFCLNTDGATSTKVEYIKEKEPQKFKYEVFCTKCGKKVGGYSSARAKVIKDPLWYTSSCCKAKLKIVQNW